MSVSVTEEKAEHKGKDVAIFIDFMVGRQRSSCLDKNGGICMSQSRRGSIQGQNRYYQYP